MNPLTRLFKKQSASQGVTLEIQSGFTAFSGTAYGSAALRSAVDTIARHAVKLQGHADEPGLERLLRESPNAYMTAYDLLYKTTTAYFTANNAFILIDRADGHIRALYPLSPASVEFVSASGGDLYARLIFADGRQVLLPYGDLIHLRRHFATNELLGSDNAPLYPLIDTAHTLNEATGAAVKNATNIRGILKFTSLVNPAQVKAKKEVFVRDYLSLSNTGGIAATDQRFEFIPTNTSPYNVPHEQVDAVNREIFAYLGVSPKIVTGEYTEDEFAAFYESLLEPLALQMSLEFSRKCGADIRFTSERLEFSSARTRISLLRELLPFGVISINEARRLLALPEVEDGDKRLQSLNYVTADKADVYQEVDNHEQTAETRAYEVRAAESPLVIEGTAIVFDQPANMHGFSERIARSALDHVDLNDITLLVNHDGTGIPLARSPKTLTLNVTENGLEMRTELPDTEQGRSVYEAVRRGDLSQMSFAFDIANQVWDEQKSERTITEIGKVYEISIVNRAAYPQTNVQARNDLAGKEGNSMNFNPIESAVMNQAAVSTNTHDTPEYRSAFFKNLLGKPLTEGEQRSFTAAQAEKRVDAFNTLSNSAAVVPDKTLNEVIRPACGVNGLFGEVRLFNVPANLSVPVGTPTDAASWHVEGSSVDRKNITTTSVTFSAYELIKVLSMSAAVRRMDIGAFEGYLTEELRNSIADAIGAAIVGGTGSGQPTGILSGVTWNDSNTISTNALTSDNLLALIAKLPGSYAGGAKFAMSTATLFGSIYPLKDGDGAYLFTDAESGGVRRLFGFPVVLDDNIPAGTVLFGNFRYYGVNVPEGVAMEVSRESGFTSGLIDFRALCIADGKPIVPGAFVKLEVIAA